MRTFVIGFTFLLLLTPVSAQSAQEVLDASRKVYAGASRYSVLADQRAIRVARPASDPAGAWRVADVHYTRRWLKADRGNRYYLIAFSTSLTLSPGLDPRVGGWGFLGRLGDQMPREASSLDAFRSKAFPADRFAGAFFGRLGGESGVDFVLRQFGPEEPAATRGNGSGGRRDGIGWSSLREPRFVTEQEDGDTFHIRASLVGGGVAHLWIEQASFLVVRSVIHAPSQGTGYVVETLYTHQQLDPKLALRDFRVPQKADDVDVPEADRGFEKAEAILMLDGLTPAPAAAASETTAPKTPLPPVPARPVQAEAQVLTTEQMAAVVLVEGDRGAGTGFITQLRDADFVVTSLSLVGGSRRLSVKTPAGEELPVQGVFGAVGADIAILRIGKRPGGLRLADDVSEAVKLTDRVVIVGNRHGGGVVRQAEGTLKGERANVLELDADFQPGNSGAPIVLMETGEVIGVVAFSQTRRAGPNSDVMLEKRWSGHRLDRVSKWEAIDPARWNEQAQRLATFREVTEALSETRLHRFDKARAHRRLAVVIEDYEQRAKLARNNGSSFSEPRRVLFRSLVTVAEDGLRELEAGEYYDYFRTCEDWESSVPAQIARRKELIAEMKRYGTNDPSLPGGK